MNHFTLSQRYEVKALLSNNFKNAAIGKHIGKSPSAVGREITRNGGKDGYDPQRAHDRYYAQRQRTPYKFSAQMQQEIMEQLAQQHSPEQITGRRKKEERPTVSHEWIYRFVYQDKANGGTLYRQLRHSHRQRKKRGGVNDNRGIIPNKHMIAERPPIVETKERFGDFEGDTIIGKQHRGALVVLTERKSKYTLVKRVPAKTALHVSNAVVELLAASVIPPLTLTVDNGKEFAAHEDIARRANIDVFFANPYHSWERGLNENTNGLIRQYFPKSSELTTLTDDHVACVQQLLNTRPRKTLDFHSPMEFFSLSLIHSPVASHC